MRCCLGALVCTWALAAAAAAQPAITSPDISGMTFTRGSAAVSTSGALDLQAEIDLSAEEVMSSDGITWLVFGDPGALVRATVVYGPDGAGVRLERGDEIAEVTYGGCTGETKLWDGVLSGRYRCEQATAYDLSTTSDTGVAAIAIEFTAR